MAHEALPIISVIAFMMPTGTHLWAVSVAPGRHIGSAVGWSGVAVAHWSGHSIVTSVGSVRTSFDGTLSRSKRARLALFGSAIDVPSVHAIPKTARTNADNTKALRPVIAPQPVASISVLPMRQDGLVALCHDCVTVVTGSGLGYT